MPATSPILQVQISLNSESVPQFTYWIDGKLSDGSVIVEQSEAITYQLINSEGFSFVGAGFITPFDGVIDAVTVSEDGQELVLEDHDSVAGVTKFQLIVRNNRNALLLLSPDPQVVNRKPT